MAMIPHERSLVKKYENDSFVIIGINSDEQERYDKEVEAKGVTWRSFMQGFARGSISTRWSVKRWPTIYLIDHKGVIRYKNIYGEEMEQALDKLVEEAKADAL